MKNASTIALAAASLLLIGQGCAYAPKEPVSELPTAPPSAAVRPATTDDEDMLQGDDAMTEKEDEGAAMKEANDSAMIPDRPPSYLAYSSEQVAASLREGRGVMLYFWAAWCPICKAEEPKIKAWVEGSGLRVDGFRVNYDTEKELKAQHKIPYQHTAVFLNAKGEEVERFNGPVSESEFTAALKKAAE